MILLGIDVSKKELVVARWTDRGAEVIGTVANTPDGFEQLAAQVTDCDVHVVLEPTGGYELCFASWAMDHGWQVSRVNPGRVRQWAQGSGFRAKTDAADARMLANYGHEKSPPVWHPVVPEIARVDELLHRRDDLEQMRLQEQNRLEVWQIRPQADPGIVVGIERHIAYLETELRTIADQLRDLSLQTGPVQHPTHLLRTVPGVGPVLSLPLLVHFANWVAQTDGQVTAEQLVASVGLDPQPHQSGTSVKKATLISKQGDARLRKLLYMGAVAAQSGKAPCYQPVHAFYQRLRAHKPARVALVATARKILLWAWAVFRSFQPFDPAHVQAAVP